jgi:hypothetical protein
VELLRSAIAALGHLLQHTPGRRLGFTFRFGAGMFKPTWIVIHHSAGPDSKVRDWVGIKKYHMSYRYQGDIIDQVRYAQLKADGKTAGLELPWNDIGYNIGLERVDGKLVIQYGRDIGTVGSHALGFNAKSIGICLVGNYNLQAPDEEQLSTLARTCREYQDKFNIPRHNVVGHRETYVLLGQAVQKSCPGRAFDLDVFRARLLD